MQLALIEHVSSYFNHDASLRLKIQVKLYARSIKVTSILTNDKIHEIIFCMHHLCPTLYLL